MVNEKLNLNIGGLPFGNGLFFSSPIIFTGTFALSAFYLLCFIQTYVSFYVWSSLFIFTSVSFLILCFFKRIFFNKKKLQKALLFSFAGLLIGCISFLRLLIFYSPQATLAEAEKVEGVKLVLTGDPLPAGEKYYSADAKLFSFTYRGGQSFSAEGNIKIFFPSEMVKQNNAFGVSVYKGKTDNACKNFSKGAVLFARGRFIEKKEKISPPVFFTAKEIPEFLGWISFFSGIRANLRFNLMRLLAGWGSAGGLLLALLSANKDFLDTACSVSFKNAGLAHILALSGMHVSLVSLTAIRMGTVFGKRSFAIKFSLFSIILFVWFAGSAPSLNRALGMMIILVAGKSLGLQPDMLSVLSSMLVLHIAVKPEDSLSLGFIFSYGALSGILLFGKALTEVFKGKIPERVLGGLSASLGAQSFTAPAAVFKIGVLAPIGILASAIISPLVSVFLILGMTGIFTAFILPSSGFIFNFILNFLYGIILTLAETFSRMPLIRAETFIGKFFFSAVPFSAGVTVMLFACYLKEKRTAVFKFNGV
ncbi:ComEC/Rec2 family competence protein [Treponema pedis]|uniref:ComEC/Rec2 family competence protein n=1 Tax=Treponema pedis TaxID=409322 RepID=UPI003D1F23A8